jgi:CheY-like chemotaxis protein
MSELVLIVDDEPGILTTLGGILSDEGYATVATTSSPTATAWRPSRLCARTIPRRRSS